MSIQRIIQNRRVWLRYYEKYKVTEIPVMMNERQEGVSSISLRNGIYYMIKVSFAILIARMKK